MPPRNPNNYRGLRNRQRRPAKVIKRRAPARKTTRSGARVSKTTMARNRRPFVEIKGRDHKSLWQTMGGTGSNIVDNVSDPTLNKSMTVETGQGIFTPVKSNFFPLWSFLNPIQGVTDQDMTGTQMVPKYLTAKVTWTWPEKLQVNNPKYYMIHGWCTVPMNLTEFTTPKLSEFTRANMIQHIINHVRRDFDESVKNEHLQFKPIETKDYTILSYQRVRPNQNANQIVPVNAVTRPAGSDASMNPAVITPLGRLGQKTMTFKWPLKNKKQRYVYGASSATVDGKEVPFLYNNSSWQPFLLYYCPSAGEGLGPALGIDNSPKIAYNDKTWFSDS